MKKPFLQSYRQKGIIAGLCILLVDQITKTWIVSQLYAYESIPLCPHFNIVCIFNKGISFGLLNNGKAWQFMVIGAGIFAVSLWLLSQFLRAKNSFQSIYLGFILGGALGNLTDRVIHGAVVDFIDFYIKNLKILFYSCRDWHWPAFNIADSAIVLGVLGLIIYHLSKDFGRNKCKKG